MATTVNPAAAAAGSGAPPVPTGSGSPAETPASPAGQQGSGAPSPGASPESPNIKQLREQYETTKGKLEPWEKLGNYEEVSQSYQTIARLQTEAVELGKELGYDEKDILDSFREDPISTQAFLRQRQAAAGGNPDPTKHLEQLVDKKLKPVIEREEQRKIEEANGRYEHAFAETMDKLYPAGKDGPSITTEEREILHQVATEMFKYDPEALSGLQAGKTAFVAKHIDAARQFLDKYFLARTQRETKATGLSGGGGGNPNPEAKGKKPTLQEMIDGTFEFKAKA